ncbi:MAG: pyridoxal phosphate-dependent aminotransferase [Gemmataceae bacterium]
MHKLPKWPPCTPGLRSVPKTGVIYVTSRAREVGFTPTSEEWANLGQGAPETGPLVAEAVDEISHVPVHADLNEYAPVAGLPALRERVAELYNALYRKGKMPYTAENVAISGGGRLALTRLAAAMGEINIGHFLPDYTAYEELLTIFKAFHPIPILLSEENNYHINLRTLEAEILGRGLSAILLSNPCNPTGQLIRHGALKNWVRLMRETACTCIFDEFYGHYVYGPEADSPVSAAHYVEDVDRDPIIIVDGLTKNWRLPGWRICWTVGPQDVIEAVTSVASFLDGGAPHLLQEATLPLLEIGRVEEQSRVLRWVFCRKREYVLERLETMNIAVDVPPQGSFYCWANLSRLPEPLNDGMQFFEEGLKRKVITVPGEFFDVNPGKRRRKSRYQQYTRISFGPSMQALERGLDGLEGLIKDFS